MCRTCGAPKQDSDFPLQRKGGFRGSDTVNYRLDCKVCTAAAARAYRKTYVPKAAFKPRPGDEYLMSAIRCRATDAKARSGAVCSAEYLYNLFVQQGGRCALSGLTMSVEKCDPFVLSLDQKVAGEGYGEGNVQWVAWAVNRAKGDLPFDDFVRMCKAIVEGVTTIPQGSTLK